MRFTLLGRLISTLVLVGLLCILTASSSYYPPLLNEWAQNDMRPFINLYRAHRAGDQGATQSLNELASQSQERHWQTLLANQGSAEAQFALASLQEEEAQRHYLLRKAASNGHPQAFYELGMLEEHPHQKVSYLTKAAQLDYQPAVNALYQWYWMQRQYEKALPWMLKIANINGEAALRLGQYYWREAQYETAKKFLESAKEQGNPQATRYITLIQQHWRKKPSLPQETATRSQCNMRLQFVATGLDSALQAEQFKSQFESDSTMQQLPICINELYWAQEKQLGCTSEAIDNYRITCQLNKLDGALKPDEFSHLVVFHASGKANVTNGVMFLDLADKYSVFIHELAHFVGFIDEYPLSEKLAQLYCQPNQQHPNLFVTTPDTEMDEISLEYWQKFQQDMSIARSRTCNNSPNEAYKLSSKMTFMEFHDSNHIPELYLSVWKGRLFDPIHMKPAALNIAQALEEVGDSNAAQKWWMRFHEWRTQQLSQ